MKFKDVILSFSKYIKYAFIILNYVSNIGCQTPADLSGLTICVGFKQYLGQMESFGNTAQRDSCLFIGKDLNYIVVPGDSFKIYSSILPNRELRSYLGTEHPIDPVLFVHNNILDSAHIVEIRKNPDSIPIYIAFIVKGELGNVFYWSNGSYLYLLKLTSAEQILLLDAIIKSIDSIN